NSIEVLLQVDAFRKTIRGYQNALRVISKIMHALFTFFGWEVPSYGTDLHALKARAQVIGHVLSCSDIAAEDDGSEILIQQVPDHLSDTLEFAVVLPGERFCLPNQIAKFTALCIG